MTDATACQERIGPIAWDIETDRMHGVHFNESVDRIHQVRARYHVRDIEAEGNTL